MDLVNAGFRSSENSSTVWRSNFFRNCAWDKIGTAEREMRSDDFKNNLPANFISAKGILVSELVNVRVFGCINLKEVSLLPQIKE